MITLNETEEWYNLEPEVQDIFRLIISHKDVILSQDPEEDKMRDIAYDLETFVLSKTTRGPRDATNPSNFKAHPQFNFFSDPLGISATLSSFTDSLKDTLPDKTLVDDILTSAKSMTESTSSFFDTAHWVIPGVAAVLGIGSYSVWGHKLDLIIGIVALLYAIIRFGASFIEEALSIVINVMKNVTFKNDDVETPINMQAVPQFDVDSTVDTLMIGLSGMINLVYPGKTTKDSFSFVTAYARGRNGFLPMMKSLLKVIENLANLALSKVPGWKHFSFLKTNHYEADRWLEEAREVIDLYNQNKFPRCEQNIFSLEHIVRTGDKLFKDLPRTNETSNWCMLIMKDLSVIKRIYADYRKTYSGGDRVETTGVLIRGGPGVYKSINLNSLAHGLAKRELPPNLVESFKENQSSYIHYKSPDATFADGYQPSTIVQCADDFGQTRDVAGMIGNEYNHVIHAIAPFTYNLNAAALEDKGNLFYNAKYFLASTNCKSFAHVQSITNIEALIRRFHVDVVQTIKPKYCTPETRNADVWSRKHMVVNEGPIDFDHLEFHVVSEQSGTLHFKEIIDYGELVNRIILAHDLRERHFRYNSETVDNLFHFFAQPQMSDDPELEAYVDFTFREITPGSYLEMRFKELVAFHYTYFDKFEGTPKECFSELVDMYGVDMIQTYFTGIMRIDDLLDIPRRNPAKLTVLREPNFLEKTISIASQAFKDLKDFALFQYSAHRQTILLFTGLTILGSMMIPIARQLYNVVAAFFALGKAEPQSFGFSDKMKSTTPVTVTKPQSIGFSDKLVRVSPPTKVATAQMACHDDQGAMDVVSKYFNSNCIRLRMSGQNYAGTSSAGSCYVLKERIILLPFHYYTMLKAYIAEDPLYGDEVEMQFFRPSNDKHFYTMTVSQFLECFLLVEGVNQEHDVAMARLPRTFPRHQSMIKHFYMEKDFKHLSTNLPVLAYFSDGRMNMAFSANASLTMEPVNVDNKYLSYVMARSLLIPLNTTVGDCGNLYAIKNRSTEGRKFCAMHVAGSPSFAHGTLLTQESIEKYVELFGDVGEFEVPDLPRTEPKLAIPQFNYVGDINPAPAHSSRTTIRKSILYGKIEPVDTTNSLLKAYTNSEGKVIDPWHNALSKYCTPPPLIDNVMLDTAVEDFHVYLKDNSRISVNHRTLTFEEALDGIENDPDFNSVKSNSSPGYPMNLSKALNLKKQIFSNPVGSKERINATAELKRQVEATIVELEKGNLPLFFCVDNLKDERRKIEKVRDGKTRAFMGIPFVMGIIKRMYFGTFLLWVHKNKISNGCAIGVNPYSSDWDQLARHLSENLKDRNDPGVGAGDYSGFDASQNVFVMWKILDIINLEYNDPVGNSIRTLLWETITNSYHIVHGQVYSWDASLPSGDLLTALINCFTNQINFRCCWIMLGLAIYLFSKKVRMNVMGDDVVYTVSPEFRSIFNDVTLTAPMALLGMTFTNESKTASVITLRCLHEVEYLKRRFIYDSDSQTYIAPLRLDVVLDMPNWTKAGGLIQKITCDNLSNAHQELSLHSKEVFEKYHPKFIELKQTYFPDFVLAHSIHHKHLATRQVVRNRLEFY